MWTRPTTPSASLTSAPLPGATDLTWTDTMLPSTGSANASPPPSARSSCSPGSSARGRSTSESVRRDPRFFSPSPSPPSSPPAGWKATTRTVTGAPNEKCFGKSATTAGSSDASSAATRPVHLWERQTQSADPVASRTHPCTIWPTERSAAATRGAMAPPATSSGRIVHSTRPVERAPCRSAALPPPKTTTCTGSSGEAEGKLARWPGAASSVKWTRPRTAPRRSSRTCSSVVDVSATRASACTPGRASVARRSGPTPPSDTAASPAAAASGASTMLSCSGSGAAAPPSAASDGSDVTTACTFWPDEYLAASAASSSGRAPAPDQRAWCAATPSACPCFGRLSTSSPGRESATVATTRAPTRSRCAASAAALTGAAARFLPLLSPPSPPGECASTSLSEVDTCTTLLSGSTSSTTPRAVSSFLSFCEPAGARAGAEAPPGSCAA
mmetsp:Transcript_35907/g.115920  ORF Transcript_35907/g.115920 Transcript_35907/m.115920 type:complete len:444 (+) Transcript_35907:1009-2340(+)